MDRFELVSDFSPAGDQPRAIKELVEGIERGDPHQVLLGVTGSGKTYTMASVVEKVQRPTLVLAHNKTLAAQLYQEFKEFFPNNAVEYFVSYFDYYQPEAYIPSTDTFIEKDSLVNDAIDRMRLSATRSLLERRDVLIVASISCIYGLGSAAVYHGMLALVKKGAIIDRDAFLRKLVEIQYDRKDHDFHRGTFRVRGDSVEVWPAYEEEMALRIEFFGDEVDAIHVVDPFLGTRREELSQAAIYPATHFVLPAERRKAAVDGIKQELRERLAELRDQMRLIEAQRLDQRTSFDLEMMETIGFCKGIENYSRHLTGREPGEPPPCLLDYFPKDDWLIFLDESHVTVPQSGGMYRGDRARKETLVEHGFRLPSALDNRPLKFDEFVASMTQAIHVSATPGDWELDQTGGVIVEQIIRPTGLLDPFIEVRPATEQVDDLIMQIRRHVDDQGQRVLVTVLTKRMAEDLTDYLRELRINVRYLHSDIDTLERTELIRDLRLGVFDVLIGINLLREGLDIPEVSLVAILDADKEGFLRAQRSLIQTSGRAARNIDGRVIMYADRVTRSMQVCIDETLRRRRIQQEYNEKHGITPRTIIKAVRGIEPPPAEDVDELSPHRRRRPARSEEPSDDVDAPTKSGKKTAPAARASRTESLDMLSHEELERRIATTRDDMMKAARALEFEEAASLRDTLRKLEAALLGIGA